MTSATRSVAVVATRLPLIDRRALSQAWFSALHVAAAPAHAPSTPRHGATTRIDPALVPRSVTADRPPAGGPPLTSGRRVPGALGAPLAEVERRRPVDPLARKMERAIVRGAATRPAQTTLAVGQGAGRVQLLVRTGGGTIRIVALCAPPLRERVDRALAAARFTLAANGLRLGDAP
jgi:hypothetical protein